MIKESTCLIEVIIIHLEAFYQSFKPFLLIYLKRYFKIMADLTSIGVYYPSRMSLMKVMILGVKILSSNDEGAASHEIRHFIDLSTLKSLQGELNLSESLIPCHPV